MIKAAVTLLIFLFSATAGAYTSSKVTLGQYFGCAIFSTGQIKCWGANTYGQLGLGDLIDRGSSAGQMGAALPVLNLGTDSLSGQPLLAKDVQAGVGHGCAIMNDNRVKCWGWNDRGQLGYEDTAMRGQSASTMGNHLGYVNLGTGLTAKALALGAYHTCALLSDNGIKCWGDNSYGQLGRGDVVPMGTSPNQMGDQLAEINLGTKHTAKSIASGHDHVCAILDDNSVKCWGYNGDGELGNGTANNVGDAPNEMGDNMAKVNLGTLFGFIPMTATMVSAGTSHTCVTLLDFQVKCWGDNFAGQLGIGSSASSLGTSPGDMGDNLPTVNLGSFFATLSQPVTQIQVGFFTTCVQLYTNQVKCWGSNYYGEVGVGSSTNTTIGASPSDMGDSLPVVNLGNSGLVKSMASDYGATCAILQDNQIKCWGINLQGSLGLGDSNNRGGAVSDMGNSLPELSF